MPDGDDNRPANLPRGAPEALKKFVKCEVDSGSLDLTDTAWLNEVPMVAGAKITVKPGATSSRATITLDADYMPEFDLDVSIVDGQLVANVPGTVGEALNGPIKEWTDKLNATLRRNGKQMRDFQVDGTTITLRKQEIPPAAAVPAAAAATATVAGGTEAEPEPAEEKKKGWGCAAWIAGAIAAIAVIVGFVVASGGDDGDDTITSDTGAPASTSTTTTSTTLAEVGQAPPPTDEAPEQAVCGNVDPAGSGIDLFDGMDAQEVAALNELMDGITPCTPAPNGYGDCNPAFLLCTEGPDPVLTGFGTPGIDHTQSVPDANTGQEGASTAEQLIVMYLATGDVRYLLQLTSDCGGNLLSGEAPLVPNGETIVPNPLVNFGSCTIVGANVIAQDAPTDDATLDAIVRALEVTTIGQGYEVGSEQPDPVPPPGFDSLTVAGAGVTIPMGWPNPAVTLGNTFAGTPIPGECLWFFSPENTELVVKVLDVCGNSGQFWVFYGATTNVEYELSVSDTAIGTSSHFVNPLGQTAPPVLDTRVFETSGPFFDNSIFPCGYGHVAYTACPAGEPAMEAGAFVTVTSAMFGPIPIEGDGTERAHTVDFGPAGGPAYEITHADDGWSVSSTAGATRARALFRENAVMLVAPQDELPEGALAYSWRTTVDGQTVEQPILPVDGLVTTPLFPADAPPAEEPPATDPPPSGTDAGAPTETLDEFYTQLSASVSSGDVGFSLDRLHPTVLEAYPTQCPAALGSFADPELVIQFVSEGETGPWTWELPDGRSFDISDATAVTLVLTGRGQPGTESEAHVAVVDNQYRWFTFCE